MRLDEALPCLWEGMTMARLAWASPVLAGYDRWIQLDYVHSDTASGPCIVEVQGKNVRPWVPTAMELRTTDWYPRDKRKLKWLELPDCRSEKEK